MHLCKVCNTEQPEDEFNIRRWKTKDGSPREALENRCKSCESERWAKNPPGMWRNSHYKREYGIDIEQYNQMMSDQEGCCAICEKHQTEFEKRLSVDHCHETGEVRGLLCDSCNIALGHFNDNPDLFRAAIDYLEDSEDKPLLRVVKDD